MQSRHPRRAGRFAALLVLGVVSPSFAAEPAAVPPPSKPPRIEIDAAALAIDIVADRRAIEANIRRAQGTAPEPSRSVPKIEVATVTPRPSG